MSETKLVRVVSGLQSARKTLFESAGKTVFLEFQFETWQPDSLHWVAPSNLLIYTDGSWYFYASHIANMRRTLPILDGGARWTWKVHLDFKNSSESIIYSTDYVLRTLNYKEEENHAQIYGYDNYLASIIGNVDSCQSERILDPS